LSEKEYVIRGLTPNTIDNSLDEISELIRKYGVVILPRFFSADKNYLKYYEDLQRTLNLICENHILKLEIKELGDAFSKALKIHPEIGQLIANLGTQPNKFASFNELKFSDSVGKIASRYFGATNLMLTPQAGDTLHIFPSGTNFHRYNLPIHQDYQYLMQSPRQLTFYLGISEYKDDVGGLQFWEKSHVNGVLPSVKNENGSFVVSSDSFEPAQYQQVDTVWNSGDLGIFDSLLCHASIPNTSERETRIVQIFRFSDCNNETAKSFNFQSTAYPRRGIEFQNSNLI